jgi:hypothetical protein
MFELPDSYSCLQFLDGMDRLSAHQYLVSNLGWGFAWIWLLFYFRVNVVVPHRYL